MFQLAPPDVRSVLGRAAIDLDDEMMIGARVWWGAGRKKAKPGAVRSAWPPEALRGHPRGQEPRRSHG
jgi:hypothetical protein